MSAKIIDGKAVAAQVRRRIAREIEEMTARGDVPGLAVVLVGDDPASLSYVRGKERDCAKVGIASRDIRLSPSADEKELLAVVGELNEDPAIHGILVQLPLPDGIDEERVIRAIDPRKDVDGFHPRNIGNLVLGINGFVPCTPLGVMELLNSVGTEVDGARAVILGRSRIVGAPLAVLLFRKAPGGNATVTVCHSRTRDIAVEARRADILVAAIGRPEFVTADMVKPGATVIDVGINRIEDRSTEKGYRLVGDVDFDGVAAVAGALTPVPGGVGPLTRAMLLHNTLLAARSILGYNETGGENAR